MGSREKSAAGAAALVTAADEDGLVDESWMNLDDDGDNAALPMPAAKKKAPAGAGRGRKAKVIGLDEVLKNRKKRAKLKKSTEKLEAKLRQRDGSISSDEDSAEEEFKQKQDGLETLLENLLAGEDTETPPRWGEQVFGRQKGSPESPESGGLIPGALTLTNGTKSDATIGASSILLRSQIILEGRCSEITARWMYHQMAYSKNWCLVKAMCNILCGLLTQQTKDGGSLCKFDWLPSLKDIMETLQIYGYMDTSAETNDDVTSEQRESISQCSEEDTNSASLESRSSWGPPANIQSLMQFVTIYVQARNRLCKLSVGEAENLVIIVIHNQLDRCMLTSAHLLRPCLHALLQHFTEEEWAGSCDRLASAISRVSPSLVNNLQAVKSLHATDSRVSTLQRLTVLQLLSKYTEAKTDLSCPEEVVSIFKSVNLTAKDFKFWNVYYLLTLADLYLWTNSSTELTPNVRFAWLDLLKKFSNAGKISSQDTRTDAMRVRNLASFLIHKYGTAEKEAISDVLYS